MVRKVSPGEFLITTPPSLTKCRKCHRPVLAATIGGLDHHVDTATLNDVGELAALMEGRPTYELVTEDYLARRTVHHISAGPARHPVLAEHGCSHIPDHHIDHAWTWAAKALIFSALGATVPVDGATTSTPPF